MTTIKINGEHITPELRERLVEAWTQAIVSRGKNKGKLKKKCPPLNTLGAACWQGMNSNPYNVGMWHLLSMGPENREVYHYFDELRKRIQKQFDLHKNKIS